MWMTAILGSATAFLCLFSGVTPTPEAAGAVYVQASVTAALGQFGPIFIACAVSLFAFTTLIGDYYYTEGCLRFLLKGNPSSRFLLCYRLCATGLIFLGAVIPYYAGERKMDVLVSYVTESSYERRSELLDGLWTAGQRTYPLIGKFHDRYTHDLEVAYARLGKNKTRNYMIRLFRQYRPDVVVTHDIRGEYGHGMHKVCADIVLNALKQAANPKADKASAKEFGLWDVPKCYIHLYEKDQVVFDWNAMKLSAFGGKTAFEVADAAWRCHLSQQKTEYRVYTDGPYDSQIFGLYRSLVGPDAGHDDFFENIPDA
jgi:LmbE family N-acetylglucosaminyl deacetylase